MAENKTMQIEEQILKPNPALKPFGVLVGEWKTIGTHGALPDTVLHGRTTFEWFENGAFLMMRSEIENPEFPTGIVIFGSDNVAGEYFMLHYDERGVSRKYDVSFQNNVLKWWRNGTDFSQRYSWTITDDGRTVIGKGELSKDGAVWEKDLDLTFTRVERFSKNRTKKGLQVSENTKDETAIRNLIEDWASAVRRKDLSGILRNHSADILMFDLPPPLESKGIEAYRKTWNLFFSWSREPVVFNIKEMSVTAGDDIAFAACVMRCSGTETGGEDIELDFRLTIGLRKIDNQWTITHEHHSIPATE